MNRVITYIILLVYVVFGIFLGILLGHFSTPECFRNECVNKSVNILQGLNSSVNPCQDLYAFICGKNKTSEVLENNEYIEEYDEETVMAKQISDRPLKTNYSYMFTKNPNDLQTKGFFKDIQTALVYYWNSISGGTTMDNPTYHERMMGKFSILFSVVPGFIQSNVFLSEYMMRTSLTNITSDDRSINMQDVLLKKYWINDFSLGIYEYNSRKVGFPASLFMSFSLRRDRDNRDLIAPYFGVAAKGPYYYEDLLKSGEEKWVNALKESWEVFMHRYYNGTDLKENLRYACRIWFKVEKLAFEARKKIRKGKLIKLSFEKLEKMFHDKYDFKGLLQKIVPEGIPLPKFVYFMVGTGQYFVELAKVFRRHSKFHLMCFMVLKNFVSLMPYITLGSQVNIVTGGYNIKSSLHEFYIENYNDKVNGLILSCAVERFNVRRSGSEILHEIFQNLNETVQKSILNSPWMDSKTKKKALKKLFYMKATLSLDKKSYEALANPATRAKYFMGFCLGRNEFFSLVSVNKFFTKRNFELFTRPITGFDDMIGPVVKFEYNLETNQLIVPVLLLIFPAFANAWPRSINYGTIAIEMVNQFTLAFEGEGRKYDELGGRPNATYTWWSKITNNRFKKKDSDCSRGLSKYFGVKVPGIENEDFAKSVLFRPLWRSISSIKLALEAYSKQRKSSFVKETILPGLEPYSPNQAFFISYFSGYCFANDEAEFVNHNTVFKIISRLKTFKETFRCKRTSAKSSQSLIDKCTLW